MKLRTSFFEPTVLKKDITRYAPVWGLYTVFTLLTLFLLWESDRAPARFVNNAPELFLAMGMVNFLYAPLVAFCLFGDLFKSRMCNALHALPLRREGWFLTHLTAGMLFCLVPNGLAALICAGLLGQYAWVAFLWLGLMVLQYLFFFGVATFGCLCSGNGLGALGIYMLVNFFAVLVSWLVITFYQPMLYGIRFSFEQLSRYSPIVRLCETKYLEFRYDNMYDTAIFGGFVAEDWLYLGISAAVGVLLLVAALFIYRKRHLESAGDMIAFKPAAPVVLTLYTLCIGAVLYFIADATATALAYIFLFIGLGIGFFTGRMLLERRVKVFRGKNWLTFGIFLVAFALSLGVTRLDPLGITRYVPKADQVVAIKLNASHYFYEINQSGFTLKEPEDIARILALHQDCIEERNTGDGRSLPLYIRYEMKNGTVVERYYYVRMDSEGAKHLQFYFSSVDAVFDGRDPAFILQNLQYLECYSNEKNQPVIAIATNKDYLDLDYYTDKYGENTSCISYELEGDPDQDPILSGLFAALVKDCQAGHMAQPWEFNQNRESVASLSIQYRSYSYKSWLNINIYEDCENTVAFLNGMN